MTTQAGFAVASCLLALALALSSFERWLLRRRPHELAWAAGLALATVAAAALAWGAGVGWNGAAFRIFWQKDHAPEPDPGAFAEFAGLLVLFAALLAWIPVSN